ncbi:homeobox and C2H2 transcription factor, putative [Paecilomyces variotii No. 5]|uniref:Homeobox and C2H2 transcription factor, putative n=1 Tax=Byssochlamys spectabilis (strain No. 5 / NBRC 109023) TaxID=1356009 RepID=V5FLD4_BYSSN|nr:homeobox and C2H2 transcription factor, putative [Paecilomyces variotii No. 5]
MEYFDFDGASFGSQAPEDDVASDCQEIDEADAVANYDTLFFDKNFQLPTKPATAGAVQRETAAAGEVEVDADVSLDPRGQPMFRAKEPCDFCSRMGLDCFVAQKGVMQNGCTCCISLYRECSFTHERAPYRYLDTLQPLTEDVDVPTGGPTGKRILKSLGGRQTYDDFDSRSRKSGARFPREAIRLLKNWLSQHSEHPYPTEQQKDELKEQTGLKRSQICNWLANARRRGKIRPSPRSSSPVPGAIDIPAQTLPPGMDVSLMTPFERWKYSPPENEAASKTAIIRAMANTQFDDQPSQPGHSRSRSLSRRTGSSNDSSFSNSNMFQAPSVSSFDTTRSSLSDMSFASAFSHRSSIGSYNSNSMDRKERRRRRKPSATSSALSQQKTRGARIFQCTFCSDSFPAKYDWQRHEKSLHLALDKWTCAPEGGIVFRNGQALCAFCRVLDPNEDHLESHNYSSCQEKTLQERTFYRKDHLNQHLRLMHNVKFDSSMESWKSATTELKSRCGFCSAQFTTWKDRVDHLAVHFKNGADMRQWQGDWGFEPFVQRLVENAMPPYLIGQEQRSMDPYKASSHNLANASVAQAGTLTSGGEPRLNQPADANCFGRLQVALTAFIHHQVAAGILPTDEMLQNEARQVIYGSDDPWNQTCADNPVWLSILKRDAGLEIVPNSDSIQFSNLGMVPPYAADGGLRHPPAELNPMSRLLRRERNLSQSSSFTSPGIRGSGFQSPAPRQSVFSSAPPSMPGSLSGSYAGSAGVSSAMAAPALASDWGSNFSTCELSASTSAPVSAPADPLVQMGFDPEFLQQLNDSYGDLHHDGMEGIGIEGFEKDFDLSREAFGTHDQAVMDLANLPSKHAVPASKRTPASDSGFSSAQIHSRSTSIPFSEPPSEDSHPF